MEVPIKREDLSKKIQEIRDNSKKWNLKGDKALLDIIEKIHKNIISNVNSTNEKCEEQYENLNRACISLMNVNNRLSSLCNTQFVENKVQEDEVPIQEENSIGNDSSILDKSHVDNKENEDSKLKQRIYTAVSNSLKALENLCEEINISTDTESGSESDNNDLGYNVVLKPKDIYTKNHLPYIIGTLKWKNKWHIGLQECSSESEDDNQIQSEDEADLSSSDDESGHEISSRNGSMANMKSTLNLPISKPQFADNQSSVNSSSTHNSPDTNDSESIKKMLVHEVVSDKPNVNLDPAPQTLIKPSDFAAELARKLGTAHNIPNVADKQKKISSIDKQQVRPENDFTSEPVFESGLSKKPASRVTGNIFLDEPPPVDSQPSNNKSLFGNENDDDYISSGLFGDEITSGSLFKSSQSFQDFNKQKKSHGLFDDVPDDEDDLFSTKKIEKPKSIVDEPTKSKLVQPASLNIKKNVVEDKKVEKSKFDKSLFDDSDNSDDNLFSFSSKAKPKSKPIEAKQEDDDFLSTKIINQKSVVKTKSLFDDLSDSDDDLFGKNKSIKKSTSTPNKIEDPIFKKVEPDISIVETKPEKINPETINEEVIEKIEPVNIVIENKVESEPVLNDSDIEESFVKEIKNDNIGVEDNFNKISDVPGLFDDIPPPLNEDLTANNSPQDDDIFSNIKGLRETNNLNKSIVEDHEPIGSHNINIFSDEPPDYVNQPENEDIPSTPVDDLFVDDKEENYANYPYYKTINKIECEIKQTKSTLFSDSDDDLFAPKEPIKKKDDKKMSLFEDISDDEQLFNKSPKETTRKTVSDLLHDYQDKTVEENDGGLVSTMKSESSKPIGKLQSNININVKALLGGSNITVADIKKNKSEPNVENTDVVIDKRKVMSETSVVKTASFDDDPRSSDSTLCNNIMKDRVKIQVKRRPPSRKARHEAVRNSVADIYTDSTLKSIEPLSENKSVFTTSLPNSPVKEIVKTIPEPDLKVPKIASVSNPINTKKITLENKAKDVFFDESDDSDIFFSSTKSIKNNLEDIFKSENKSVIKKKPIKNNNQLFDSDSDSDLFSGSSKTTQKQTKNKTENNIFDDDVDDIFKVPNKTIVNSIKKEQKSLFDDDDGIEDIFSVKKDSVTQKVTKTATTSKSTVTKKPNTLTTSNVPFEDPLSSFLNK